MMQASEKAMRVISSVAILCLSKLLLASAGDLSSVSSIWPGLLPRAPFSPLHHILIAPPQPLLYSTVTANADQTIISPRPQGSERGSPPYTGGLMAARSQQPDEGQSSNWVGTGKDKDCCYRVKVAFTRGRSNGAYKLHPYAFGFYTLEPGLVHGRPHYTSEDGRFALAFCGDSWWVQLAANRGECRGWFHSGWETNRCVSDIEYTWRFYIPDIDTFIDAGKGLSVWCKS